MNDDILQLKDLILQNLDSRGVSATGFHQCKCEVCGDKQVRAGFKFTGNEIIYQCFRGRCDATVVYESGKYPSRKFRNVLRAYGVELPTEIKFQKRDLFKEILDQELFEAHTWKEVEFPDDFVMYDPDYHTRMRDWLAEYRDMHDEFYMVGRKNEWAGRLIVPFFHFDKLIGWQGVDVTGKKMPKYLGSSGNSDMLYMPSGSIPNEPFVFEGVFDAKSVPRGIACLSNRLTKKQAYFLRNKNPILVPDRKDSRFLDVAKQYGWRVCIPEWNVKDVNEARCKWGQLVTAKMLYDGICDDFYQAQVRYELWREKSTNHPRSN